MLLGIFISIHWIIYFDQHLCIYCSHKLRVVHVLKLLCIRIKCLFRIEFISKMIYCWKFPSQMFNINVYQINIYTYFLCCWNWIISVSCIFLTFNIWNLFIKLPVFVHKVKTKSVDLVKNRQFCQLIKELQVTKCT